MDFQTAKVVVSIILAGFAGLELLRGRFVQREASTRRDVFIDAVTTLGLPLLVVPIIFVGAPRLAEALVPASEGWLAWLPAPEMFCILLIADDLTQYGWHRLSHTSWLQPSGFRLIACSQNA
jgi:sterol desaturase/sphingolipid hydroxylase (fatty acid hydroxylase superfamily)